MRSQAKGDGDVPSSCASHFGGENWHIWDKSLLILGLTAF